MARILIESKNVLHPITGEDTGYNHAYLLYDENDTADSSDSILRGGPSGPVGGYIIVQHSISITSSDDARGSETPTQRGSTTVTATSVQDKWSIMTQVADQIEDAVIGYGYTDDNSNSVIKTVLHSIGQNFILPGNATFSELAGAETILDFERDITGTGNADFIQGWNQNDTLVGGGGYDTLKGGGGKDSLYVLGDDGGMLYGGTGADKFFSLDTGQGAFGTVAIMDAERTDRIYEKFWFTGYLKFQGLATYYPDAGGPGVEGWTINLGGSTYINLDYSGGTLYAGNFAIANFVNGQLGIYLNTGTGGATPTALNGTSGNDTLTPTVLDYSVTGGNGADVVVITNGLNGYVGIQDFIYADGDRIDISSFDQIDSLDDIGTVDAFDAQLEIGETILDLIGVDVEDIDETYFLSNTMDYGAGETVSGTSGADTIFGTFADDVYSGNADADIINGYTGDDTISGGAGNDTLDGSYGADSISGDGDADVLYGNGGNDTLDGGSGNDTLNGGAGNDSMLGGTNDDTYVVEDAGDVVTENSSEGTDSVLSSVTYTLGSHVESLTLTGAAAIDGTGNAAANTLIGNDVANALSGGDGNDTMNGEDGADTIDGGIGDDFILGGDGNDSILGGTGSDYIDGEGGIDTLSFAGSSTWVSADLGNNSFWNGDASWDNVANVENLTGSDHNDFLYGTSGANVISGGTGGDALYGQGGNDTLLGNAGDDQLYAGAGDDLIIGGNGSDYIDGGADSDTISYAGSSTWVSVDLGGNSHWNGDAAWDSVTNVENIIGSDHADYLYGNSGANAITGGLGADNLTGGSGADTFVYLSVAEGGDIVADFVHGADFISLSAIDADTVSGGDQAFTFGGNTASTIANNVTWSESGGNTIVRADHTGDTSADWTITLTGTGLGLTSADFVL